MSTSGDRPAERIIGRYALYGEIAAGGMATVHFGRLLGPVGFSRTVAIKRLHPQYAKDPEFVSMFLDEARVAARIQHPNVVSTLDVVALEGELFLVMEYVQGESLAKLSRIMRQSERRIPLTYATAISIGVLHGLHAAHEAKSERDEPLGIVHRDVSPQNVLVGVDGVARVLDFGVAKAAGRIQTTREGQVKGKLAYMPPEQLGGAPMDRRTDIYAASVVLWETLAGRRLFDGESEAVVFAKVLHGEVEPPSKYASDCPPALDEVVLRGLSRDPEQRFATAREMAVAIEDCVHHASPRRVGEWVEQCAGEALRKRAEKVKEIESVTSDTVITTKPREFLDQVRSDRTPLPRGLPLRETSESDALSQERGLGTLSRVSSVSSTQTPTPRNRSLRGPLVLGGALLLGGLAAFVTMRVRTSGDVASSDPASAATPEAREGSPVGPESPTGEGPSPAPTGTTAPSTEPASSAAPVATETAAPAAPPAVVPLQPKQPKPPPPHVQAPPKPPPEKPAAPSCNPPFTVDAKGIRRIKPECL
jgi:eukaryotic-like serine/threonine-protein kinase